MNEQWRLDRQKTKKSKTISRFPFSRTFARPDGDDPSGSVDGAKGPYGLTTLAEPREGDAAVADLVFVHGLAGGSQSTWSKWKNPALFWPKEWLPNDSDFENVRIHSFGYNSDWIKDSTLNIHDFAKSLLGSIQDSPSIRNSQVRTL